MGDAGVSEIWKAVPGFEGLYEVSDLGRVRSLDRTVIRRAKSGPHPKRIKGKMLVLWKHPTGYRCVYLCKDGETFVMTVQKVVADTFLGPRPEGTEVCHWDGDKTNNRLENLRYDTRKANREDSRRHDTLPVGSRSPMAKLTEAQIPYVRSLERKMSQQAAGDLVGVSRKQIARIWSRENWRHV